MTGERSKLSVYAGERARTEGAFLADVLAGIFARHELALSIVMRGVAGFGPSARLRTDRLLSLSEDPPLVTLAVDTAERIEAVRRDVERLRFTGLVTTEPVAPSPIGTTRLTVHGRRGDQRTVVAALHDHGVAGATALLGIDGTRRGVRRRARLVGDNRDVPVVILAVGAADRISAAMTDLGTLGGLEFTLEAARVCRRDGVALEDLHEAADGWQKLIVYTSEATGQHDVLIERLRRAGAAGATALRGVWGYHGDHEPHGDHLLQLRRRVPVVCELIDTPANIGRWAPIVEEVTAETGLVTSQLVPAFRELP